MRYLFNVPDMSCNHCKMRIEAVVGGREEVEKVDVDLESKKVEVHSSLDPAELIDLFDQAGYDAELLQDN